jgi:hypothetical protein
MAHHENPPSPRICACPGCEEIVELPAGTGELPLYHSKECRYLARKLRRAARREMTAPSAPSAGERAHEPAASKGPPAPGTDPALGTDPAADTDADADMPPVAARLPASPIAALGAAAELRRSAAGPGAHRGEPTRGPRWALAITAGTVAAAVAVGLLVLLSQGSRPHHRVLALATATPTLTSAPSTKTPAPTSKKRPHHGPTGHSAPPVVVPVANTSPAPPTASPSPSPTRSASRPSPAPAHFAALAGAGCPASARFGTSNNGGWYTQSGGGWARGGCSGMFVNKWDHRLGAYPTRTFTWWFHTGIAGSATCKVHVYIPAGSGTTVGSDPASYTVFTGSSGKVAGTFTLDQRDNHGKWLYAGAFPARGGLFSVQVDNIDGGPDEVAADAVSVSCTA